MKGRTYPRWTPEQDAFLRANRMKMTAAKMAGKLVDRTKGAVAFRCQKIGAYAGNSTNAGGPAHRTTWTEQDDNILREKRGTMTAAEIGRMLGGRTTGAVRRHARVLGLHLTQGKASRVPRPHKTGRSEPVALSDVALRDYFAAAAAIGMIANPHRDKGLGAKQVAEGAYFFADAMLKARVSTCASGA